MRVCPAPGDIATITTASIRANMSGPSRIGGIIRGTVGVVILGAGWRLLLHAGDCPSLGRIPALGTAAAAKKEALLRVAYVEAESLYHSAEKGCRLGTQNLSPCRT